MATLNQNLERLSTARDDIADAIIAKGGTVNSGDGFEDFPDDIASISTTNLFTLGSLLTTYGIPITLPYTEQNIINGISNDLYINSNSYVCGVGENGDNLYYNILTENTAVYIPLKWMPARISTGKDVRASTPVISIGAARILDLYLSLVYEQYIYSSSSGSYSYKLDYQLVAINESVITQSPEIVIPLNEVITSSRTVTNSGTSTITTNNIQWSEIDKQYDEKNLALKVMKHDSSVINTSVVVRFDYKVSTYNYKYAYFSKNS